MRLNALAKTTGRTKTALAQEAILEFIGDLEDFYLAETRAREPKNHSFERRRAATWLGQLRVTQMLSNTSTLRDQGRVCLIEVDHIVGFMLERARAHGVDDGLLAVEYPHLKAYEARRGRNKLRIRTSSYHF